jgi:hypothetical protein
VRGSTWGWGARVSTHTRTNLLLLAWFPRYHSVARDALLTLERLPDPNVEYLPVRASPVRGPA